MNFYFPHYDNKEKQIDDLLDIFRTNFWLEEHQWFVQCDWKPFETFNHAILYTFPYNFDEIFYYETMKSKSSSRNKIKYLLYNYVNILRHHYCETTSFNRFISFSPQFYKINIPLNNNFLLCILSFNQLNSLDLTIYENSGYSQLQLLVDRASYLNLLILLSSTNLQMNLFQTISTFIRRLDLMTKSAFCLQYFFMVNNVIY